MADVAQTYVQSIIILNSKVTAALTDTSTGQVTVQWATNNVPNSGVFDKVVLTTDMWTNSGILQNNTYWNSLYEKYVGYPGTPQDPCAPPPPDSPVWPLMWGMCYIHTDSSMLSPDLMEQEETLQFNAYYAPGTNDGNYNLCRTFTTYIQKNVLEDPDADGLYLTMYGYIPDPAKDKVPDSSKVLFQEQWTHGKWTPSFMGGPKADLHMAQGFGNVSYPGQMNTNIYFAGNNTTADSEEGALDSAMALANYAFGVEYPLAKLSAESLFAYFMYTVYHNVMFPKQNAGHAMVSMYQTLPAKEQLAMITSPPIARSQVKTSATTKKTLPKMVATKKVKKAKRKPANTKANRKPAKTKTNKARPAKAQTKRVKSTKAQAKKAKPTRTKPAKTNRKLTNPKKAVVKQVRRK